MDYRVRVDVAKCLEQRQVRQRERQVHYVDTSFQLALCYKLGFGVPKDDNRAESLLQNSAEQQELSNQLTALRTATDIELIKSAWDDIIAEGYFAHAHYLERFQSVEQIKAAILYLERGLGDFTSTLGQIKL